MTTPQRWRIAMSVKIPEYPDPSKLPPRGPIITKPQDAPTAPRPSPHPVDIDALQKLYDASTPGEWRAEEEPRGCSIAAWLEGDKDELAGFHGAGTFSDAKFCAASHNAMPQLLAEVRELREACEHVVGLYEPVPDGTVSLISDYPDKRAWRVAAEKCRSALAQE